jgi:hypothetical protein
MWVGYRIGKKYIFKIPMRNFGMGEEMLKFFTLLYKFTLSYMRRIRYIVRRMYDFSIKIFAMKGILYYNINKEGISQKRWVFTDDKGLEEL